MLSRPAKDIAIKEFDDHRWIVNTSEGRNILINERAAGLLRILSTEEKESNALEKFQKQFDLNLTAEEFESLIQTTFKGLNILKNEKGKPYKKTSYLSLKVPLLNEKVAGLLANPLSFLFRPSIFWPTFTCLFILNGIVSFSSFSKELHTMTQAHLFLLTILVGSSMLVHELGHIASCRQFGIRHGAIGFGFYFIFPVVYADITQVWNATKQQRIIANAGGIYAELIYASILLLISEVGKDTTFLWAAITVFIKAIAELNPFIRYDGYWLLSDTTNTPNLMKKSNDVLKKIISPKNLKNNIVSLFKRKLYLPHPWLLFYGIANLLLLVAYFVYVIINFHSEITHFPFLIASIIQKTVAMQLSFRDFPQGFLWILGLYILTFKMTIQLIIKKAR